MSKKYSIGLDYGTLSGRALLVDVENGEELAVAVHEYPHSVMSEYLPDGETKLPFDWALQHPQDYLDVISVTIPEVIRKSGVNPSDIIGIGVDFTACTVLPVTEEGTPLCFFEEYKSEPHAYVKLWKHHAAQDKANKLNEIAAKRGEKFLARYGGKISSEWMFAKLWQIVDEAEHIYRRANKFIEAADWIVWQLTGNVTRNSCTAGYKAIWHKQDGFPASDFFKELDPRLENVIAEKIPENVTPLGSKAGGITAKMAEITGLCEGTAVSVGNIDAHVTAPAVKACSAGKMFMIMGTSTCHMIVSDKEVIVPGMCGVVEDGIVPGFFGYEAGQACVGDHFQWFIDNCLPKNYFDAAEKRGVNIHKYLRECAQKLKPGESGLVALDWWNGNRSILVDVDLTGMILGMTLLTKPEEIYRALIEATAYGTRTILDAFKQNGVAIDEIIAAGGIAEKDPMMMQIYADVLNTEIKIAASSQAVALGSAIFGAVAAGSAVGGYNTVIEAAEKMGKVKTVSYRPISENVEVYQQLFEEYTRLHDYFGRGGNDVMKRLKAIKKRISD